MASWTDDQVLLPASDRVLCAHVRSIATPWVERDRTLQARRQADVQTDGSPVGPRCGPAPCVPAGPRGAYDAASVVPSGWLLAACARSPNTNQLTYGRDRVCTRTHQAFMNTTRRGTGTAHGSART